VLLKNEPGIQLYFLSTLQRLIKDPGLAGIRMLSCYNKIIMQTAISHDRQEETIEAKARWFQTLTLQERMELLCAYTDMILEINPKIVEQKNAQPVKGRVLILSQT
jgi:hypothetical protein